MSAARDLLREIKDVNVRLLTEPQLKFLEDVLSVIESEGDPLYLLNDDRNNSICIQMREIQEKFKSIIRHLKNGEAYRQQFLTTYPGWLKLRKDSVVKLREIAKDINSDRFNCNVSQLVGHSASAVGGVMCLASAISIPFTLGLTTPLAIAGGSILAAGCSTSIGTSITEITLLNNKVREAQEVVKKDKAKYEELSRWLTRAQELEKALSEVLNINIRKDIKESVNKLTKQILESYEKLSNSKIRAIEGLQKIFRYLPEPLKTSIPLTSIAPYIFILVAIGLLYLNRENNLVLDLASVTLRGLVGFLSLLDDSKDIARIAGLFTRNTVLANNIGKAVFKGVLSAAGIALDVVGIVMTSIDLSKGSCAPQADKIEKAAEELEKEAALLKEVYENLMNSPKSLMNPPKSSMSPPKSSRNPPKSLINPPKSSMNPPKSSMNPPESLMNLQKSSMNPPKSLMKPPNSSINPAKSSMNPAKSSMNPPKSLKNPPKSKKRKPQIIIYNVWDQLMNEEVEESISNDNQLDRQEVNVLFKFRTERGWYWVLEVGAYNFARIMRMRKIKLGRRSFNFSEYIKPIICYRCGAFGHKQSFCRDRQVCLSCGEQGHKSVNCSNSFFRCINCSKHNMKFGTDFNVKHSCFSKNCRSLKIEIDAIWEITDYGGY